MSDEFYVRKLKEREKAFNNSPMVKLNVDLTSFRKFQSLDSEDIIALQTEINSVRLPHPVNVPAKFLTYNGHNKVTTAYHLRETQCDYKLEIGNKLPFMNALCIFQRQDQLPVQRTPRKSEKFIDYSQQIKKCAYQHTKIHFDQNALIRLSSPRRRQVDPRQEAPRMRAQSTLLLQRSPGNQ